MQEHSDAKEDKEEEPLGSSQNNSANVLLAVELAALFRVAWVH